MTLTTSSMGLMANHRNIINASDYTTADSRIVQDTTGGYADDDYVQCVVPDTPMVEIGPLPDLSLVGPYKMYIHGYTGTPTSYLDVYLDVYEDDDLVVWDTGTHTGGELVVQTYTPEVWLSFEPDKEYRLVLRTGASTSDTLPTVIDYIHLQQLDFTFTDYALWSFDEKYVVAGGAPTDTKTVNTGLPVINSIRSANVAIYYASDYDYHSYFTKLDSTAFTATYVARSGNLPINFTSYFSITADIELPFVRGHGDV